MKNIKLITLFLLINSITSVFAQNVGIGIATPNASAKLDISDANRGLLIPRIVLTATNVAAPVTTPATSLLVYNTNTNGTGATAVSPGFYYWNGTIWVRLNNSAWLLNGNVGTNDPAVPATYGTSAILATENFLGTTDAQDLVLGTNNIERFRMKQNTGYIGLGTASPIVKMDIVAPDTMGLRILSGNSSRLTYLSLGRNTEYAQIGATTAGTFFTDALTGDMAVKNFNTGKLLLGASYIATADMAITPTYGNVGVKTVTPNSRFDINGDLAMREGPAITLANTTYPTINLTLGNEYSHFRLTGPTIPFWLYAISNGNDGQVVTFINTTGQPMNIYNWDNTGGILTGTGNHLTSTATANSSVSLIYNASLARWIVTSYTGMSDNYDDDWHTNGNAVVNTPASPATYGTTLINNATENWIGTRGADDFTIGTNNIERFRLKQTTGNIGIGLSAPAVKLHVYSTVVGQRIELPSGASDGLNVWHYGTGRPIYAWTAGASDGIYSYSTSGNGVYGFSGGGGYGMRAYSGTGTGLYASSGNAGYGVYGYSPAYIGVYGNSANAGSYGVLGYSGGNYFDLGWVNCTNCGSPTTSTWGVTPGGTGAGGAGEYIGIQGKAYYANLGTYDKMGGMFYVAGYNGGATWGIPAFAAVGSVVDNTTYKIVGFGIVSTLVKDAQNNERIMVAPEAPEALFQDYGVGKLENGKASVKLDATLTKNIRVDDKHPMKVFIQLEGECNGVFVTNKSSEGFDVVELKNGNSNISFSYQIVANRADEERSGQVSKYSDMRFKPLNRQFILDKEKVQLYSASENDRIESDKAAAEETKKSLEQIKKEKYNPSEGKPKE